MWLWGEEGWPRSQGYVLGVVLVGEKGRKRKISPKVVELALTAPPSKVSGDRASSGPQAGKELSQGLPSGQGAPDPHARLPPPPASTYSQSLIFALTCVPTFALHPHRWHRHYLLVFLRGDNQHA